MDQYYLQDTKGSILGAHIALTERITCVTDYTQNLSRFDRL